MSDDVIVSCKLLHGLYLDVKGKRIRLNGIMHSKYIERLSFTPDPQAVGLTKVPREFWQAWLAEHQTYEPVLKGLIFASEKKQDALDEAKEKTGVKHGLERISNDDLPHNVQRIAAGQAV
ncbi:hypothetical protein COMNV_01355 [Commensalibacter sp. Nvir]|uniref:hypothetical protein n=1 Tax=Commensalibacter sp. Nvir TaxID=3069817 RepID=UPI002D34701F|nr:hypothetical protein COMNV_01355 [Commensalibacter sp. Nvir]